MDYSNNRYVGSKFPEIIINNKSSPGVSSDRNEILLLEEQFQRDKASDSVENAAFKCKEECIISNLLVKIKKENENHCGVIEELVGYTSSDSEDLNVVKAKNNQKRQEERTSFSVNEESPGSSNGRNEIQFLKEERQKRPSSPAESAGFECKEECIVSNLVAKIKKENENGVTEELVQDINSHSKELLKVVKAENNQGNQEEGNTFGISKEIMPCNDTSCVSAGDQQTKRTANEQLSNNPDKALNLYCISSRVKLLDVSVRLEDLFSNNLRRLGKAHSGSGSCLCVYCRREYKDAGVAVPRPSPMDGQQLSRAFRSKTKKPAHKAKNSFKCNECSATLKTKDILKRHLRTHSSEKPFKCECCPATFKSREGLKFHLAISHSNARPFKCKLCPATFPISRYLKSHLLVHSSDKPHSCALCPAKFKLKSNLTTHLLNHSKERPFQCTLCDKKFAVKSRLSTHMATHNERSFECKQCSAKFKTKLSLKIHSRVHSFVKPFKCQECSATFQSKQNLKIHLVVHTDKRPFKCGECLARYNRKECLRIHQQVHTSQKHKLLQLSNLSKI